MNTFKQQINDNRFIMVIAPISGSMCKLVVNTIHQIKENNINIPLDRQHLWALISSSYVLSKNEESNLLETLSYMGFK